MHTVNVNGQSNQNHEYTKQFIIVKMALFDSVHLKQLSQKYIKLSRER